ncbi:hypothetical protein CSAL01_09881 [Colletotrichum salicis]|uniref:Uncharacterized protein n=1 Tax=Colletotrichum salicis TaxID=1209931 RepID=A0A135V1G2_9PEZI|nr:hypothetical protein CSAL01_09881 [Colletotrichum salicis]
MLGFAASNAAAPPPDAPARRCCYFTVQCSSGVIHPQESPQPFSAAYRCSTADTMATPLDDDDFTTSPPNHATGPPSGRFECSLRFHVLVRVKCPASALCKETAYRPGSAAQLQTN